MDLYRACSEGNKDMARRELLSFNNIKYVHPVLGDTPLHQACRQGWLDIIRILIERYGCDPNVLTKLNRESALHYACRHGHFIVVEYLISKQCLNPLLRDNSQLEPLDYALDYRNFDIAAYICQHCISSSEILDINRIRTTVNLITTVDLSDTVWITANGCNIHQLLMNSKSCILHMPSACVLKMLLLNCTNIGNQSNFYPTWRTGDGDNLLELACQSDIFLSQTSSDVLVEGLKNVTITLVRKSIPDSKTADGEILIHLICQSETCVSHVSTAVLSQWLSDTAHDLKEIIVSPMWKTADGDTLLKIICNSEAFLSQIPSTVILKWLGIATSTVAKVFTTDPKSAKNVKPFQQETCVLQISPEVLLNWLKIIIPKLRCTNDIPSWRTADGDTVLQLVCQSEICMSKIFSAIVFKQLDIPATCQVNISLPVFKAADGDTLLQILYKSETAISLISSEILSKWRTDITLLISLVKVEWKAANGDTLLQLVSQSEKSLARISAAIFFNWLYNYASDTNPPNDIGDCNSFLPLIYQIEKIVPHISSAVLSKWLKDATVHVDKIVIPEWKTTDGDTVLELICQCETCISQISSAVLLKWLHFNNLNQVKLSIPDTRTADGDTLLQVVLQSETTVSHISSAVLLKWLSDTTFELTQMITPKRKTADGDTLLQLVCQSEICLSRISSPVLLEWLRTTTLYHVDKLLPDSTTADDNTLIQLIFHSETAISRISSKVLLKWLTDTTCNLAEVVKPKLRTADGSILLELVCKSKVTVSRISSVVLSKWLRDTAANINLENIKPEWRTADGVNFLQLVCQSEACLSRVSSLLLSIWLQNTNLYHVNESLPDSKTTNGDTLLEVVLRSPKCISRISSFVLSKWLSDSNHDNIDSLKMINPNWKTLDGDCIFHILCQCDLKEDNIIELIRYYTNKNMNPDTLDSNGNTVLHIACQIDKPDLVSVLLKYTHCDPNIRNKSGSLPLDMTTNPEVINYLCQHDQVVVHSRTFTGWLNNSDIDNTKMISIMKVLIDNYKCRTADGSTLLHLMCKLTNQPFNDQMKLIHYLLSESHIIDLNSLDNNGRMPLQLTSDSRIMKKLVEHGAKLTTDMIFNVISYQLNTDSSATELLRLAKNKGALLWNPNDRDNDGYTALHLACKACHSSVVKFLLTVAHSDPNIGSNSGEVPLQATTNVEIIKDLIRHGAKTSIMYKFHKKSLGTGKPIKPPVKVFVVGNPFVGKSTLTAALKKKKTFASRLFNFSSGIVSDVDKNTVGIVPHDLLSDFFGRVTFYDFAGHREFYSGHAALLQTAIQSTPPVFLLVVNLCDGKDDIIKNILYWISFLENQCASVSCKPHVILVGSHADVLKGINPKEKVKKIVDSLSSKCFTNMEYIGFVAMNCQYHKSAGMSDLRRLLIKSCEELRIHEPITFNAHCFLVFLIDKFVDLTAVTIKNVFEKIDNQQTKEGILEFLPEGIQALYKICLELNDRGHILLLRDRIAAENSYIVIDKDFLLSEISGTVFAPEGFRQYTQLSTNTGVVPRSKLGHSFPGKDLNIVTGFLEHLEFCHEIADQALHQLISEQYSHIHDTNERYYLFPGLILVNAKDSIWKTELHFDHNFGWCLECINGDQFFSSRFLQVLLLRLAFSYALKVSGSDHKFGIHRKCSVWKNGIFWGRNFNMDVLVEVSSSKSVNVMARFDTSNLLKCVKHRSEILQTILECVKQFCPRIETVELFIDSSSALQYPFELNSNKTLRSVQDLCEALVSNCEYPSVVLSDSGKSVPVRIFISYEPYSEIEPILLQELWDKQNEIKVISDDYLRKALSKLNWFTKIFYDSANIPSNKDALFQELLQWRGSEMTYKQFRQKLDKYSVFAGRNVLDIAGYKCEASSVERDETQISSDQISGLNEEGSLPKMDVQTLEGIEDHGGKKELTCKQLKLMRPIEEREEQREEKTQRKLRVYGNKPKLHELQLLKFPDGTELRIMEKLVPKWKQMAIALGFDGTRIETIEMSALRQPRDACLTIFTDWLAGGHNLKPPTWNALIQSLRAANITEIVHFSIEIEAEDACVSTSSAVAVDTGSQLESSTDTHDIVSGNDKVESSNCKNDKYYRTDLNVDKLTGPSQTEQAPSIVTMLNIQALEVIEGCGGRKVRVIESIGSQWEVVAKALDIGQEDIDMIKTRHSDNDEDACHEMLATWLEGNNGEVSWTTFNQALIDAGLPELADSLKDVLKLDNVF